MFYHITLHLIILHYIILYYVILYYITGAYVIASTLDILIGLVPSILTNYPKLQSFYSALIGTKAFDGIRDFTTYFKL